MSQIDINFSKTKQIAQKEEDIAKQIKQIEHEIDSVINSLDIESKHISQLKKNLRINLENVTTLRQRLHVLSTTLTQVMSLYEQTEKSIANTKGKKGSGKSANSGVKQFFSDLAYKIRKLTGTFGLDSACAFSSDPVNLCTGNYVYENTFLSLDNAMDMKFRIFYNIQNLEIGALGTGWTHTYESRLIADGDTLSLLMDDGSRMNFQRNKDGLYYPLFGTSGECEVNEEETVITDKENYSFHFDKNSRIVRKDNIYGDSLDYYYNEEGNLDYVEDNYGNKIRFKYNSFLQIREVTDHSGRSIQLFYKNGQLSSIKDVEDRTLKYEYDSKERLYKLINADGVTALINKYDDQGRTLYQEFPDGGSVNYEYLDDSHQVKMTEQNGNEIFYEHDSLFRNTRVIYSDGEESFTYDDDHNITSYTNKRGNTYQYSYDENGNRTALITPLEDSLEFEYNDLNQLESAKINGNAIYKAIYNDENRLAEMENGNGGKEYLIYDDKGNVVTWIKLDGSHVDMEYNDAGHIISITNGMGGKTTYEYDSRCNVVSETDPLGNYTKYTYNEADEIVRVENAEGNIALYDYDKSGNLVYMQDYNGNTARVVYNAFRKPEKIIDPDGNTTTFEYDKMWNLIRQVDPEGGVTTFEYDELHRIIRATDPKGGVNELRYDACNNLIERKNPNGGIYKIEYDALNRPVTIIDPSGHVVKGRYDSCGNVNEVIYQDGSSTKYSYDLTGNIVSSVTPDGYKRYYDYDKAGNLICVSDDDYVLEEYEYYPDGLLKKEKYVYGFTREFQYDINENLIGIINEEGGRWSFTYDCLQRVIRAEDPSGFVENYEYDALDNVTKVINGNGDVTSYSFNASGFAESVIDANGNETRFVYDRCNRISEILQSEEGLIEPGLLNQFNENQKKIRVTKLERDAVGNIISQTDPSGNITRYEYDGEGRIISQLDPDNNLTTCEFNPDGTQKSFTFADGRSIQLSYNGLKQLIQMEDWLGITRVDVDRMGRTVGVTTPDKKHVSYEWGVRGEQRSVTYPDGKKVEYFYDNQLRLASTHIGKDVINYDYYDNGRLKEKQFSNGFATQYSYHPSGQISTLAHLKNHQIIEKLVYQYDNCNRKQSITRENEDTNAGIYEYQYTSLGGLAKVIHDGIGEEEYKYDGFGNRIWSKVFDQETTYSYNNLNQMIEKKDYEGIHQYLYDNRGNLSEEKLNGASVKHYSFDALNRLKTVKTSQTDIEYIYNGNGDRVGRNLRTPNGVETCTYLYDISKPINNLMTFDDGQLSNVLWDGGLLGIASELDNQYYLNDERMTPKYIVKDSNILASFQYDSFGMPLHSKEIKSVHGFTGHRMDYASGLIHADAREYDPSSGRFISMDLVPAAMLMPLTLNAYLYCTDDPINYVDPSGLIAAWLAGGIVGAVANVAIRAAGDIVSYATTGKVNSSWEDYVGSATGGFVQGSVFVAAGVASGGNLQVAAMTANAAGAATETLVSNGLKMATGRAKDGYGWGNLMKDTAISAIGGASTGAVFGAACKFLKLPGFNQGRGSYEAVWKGVMTKAAKDQIKNVTLKTLYKGLVVYGVESFFDQILVQGKKAAKNAAKDFFKEVASAVFGGTASASVYSVYAMRRNNAKCAAGA